MRLIMLIEFCLKKPLNMYFETNCDSKSTGLVLPRPFKVKKGVRPGSAPCHLDFFVFLLMAPK